MSQRGGRDCGAIPALRRRLCESPGGGGTGKMGGAVSSRAANGICASRCASGGVAGSGLFGRGRLFDDLQQLVGHAAGVGGRIGQGGLLDR